MLLLNTLMQRQKGCLFVDDTFKRIFLNENVRISIKISLKFVPKVPINNIPALFQIMAWRRPATSHYLKRWWSLYWRIYASLGLNEVNSNENTKVSCYYCHLSHRYVLPIQHLETHTIPPVIMYCYCIMSLPHSYSPMVHQLWRLLFGIKSQLKMSNMSMASRNTAVTPVG